MYTFYCNTKKCCNKDCCNNRWYFSIPYIETSAATGENVQLAVNLLLHRVMQRLKRYMRDIRYNYEDEVSEKRLKNHLFKFYFRKSSLTKKPRHAHCVLKLHRHSSREIRTSTNHRSSFQIMGHLIRALRTWRLPNIDPSSLHRARHVTIMTHI